MPVRLTWLLVVAGVVLPAGAWADPPELKGLAPHGVRRGEATELVVSGSNLKEHPRLIAPFAFAVDPATANSGDAGTWKPKVTIAADVPVGVYPVRVQTDDGLSAPMLLAVDQLPQVAEKEDNSTFETAQAIPGLVVVEGQAAGNDVDYFKFPGKKGQRIVVDAQCARIGSGVDPTLRLTTAARIFVASADDSAGLLTDARLTAVLPEDTDYVIELSDSRYQGGNNPIYRLMVGPVPMAEEVYPLGGRSGETVGFELRGGSLPGLGLAAATLKAADGSDQTRLRIAGSILGLAEPLDVESLNPVVVSDLPELREPTDPNAAPIRAAAPVVLNGRIDPAGDEDRFVIAVRPGQKLRVRVQAADLGSSLDGQLQVLGAKDSVLATADDSTLPPLMISRKGNKKTDNLLSPDPAVEITAPAGQDELTLVLRDLEGRGGVGFPYRITVEPVHPSFEVQLDDAQVSIPKGGTVAVDVGIIRKGYNGPITLSASNLPAGLSQREGKVADGQLVGLLTLTASPEASFDLVRLHVVGRGETPEGPIVSEATRPLVYAQQANFPTNLATQTDLPAVLRQPAPLRFETAEAPVEVALGSEAQVALKVQRHEGADSAIEVASLPLPPGLSVANGKVAEKAPEGQITVKAAPETALGLMTIALTGKGKVGGKDRVDALPGVTLNVVRPAAVELAAPGAEVKAGESVEIKGKVARKGAFKGEVTVKLNNLPAGVKAEPVKLGGDASEFTLRLTTQADTAAANTPVQVAISYPLGGKDYTATPPATLTLKVNPAK